jgi:hypothetical protein
MDRRPEFNKCVPNFSARASAHATAGAWKGNLTVVDEDGDDALNNMMKK